MKRGSKSKEGTTKDMFLFDNKGRRRYTRLSKEDRGGGRRRKTRGKKVNG
jgi:hypothetical protein